jgi:hypothetical protein
MLVLAAVSSLVAGFAVSSCDRPGEDGSSSLDYLTMNSSGCTLRYAREPEIRLCIQGNAAGGASLERAKDYSKRALLSWFRALRQIDDKVTNQVVFSCNKPHLKVQLDQGNGTSMGRCGYTRIYSQRPYGTYLHEFGHAVAGLADTYSGGSAGNCVSGQPQSVMCWGAYGPKDGAGYNHLFPDDVKGIQNIYRKIMGSTALQAPKVKIDPYGALDPNNPWPIDEVPATEVEKEPSAQP